eukprot:9288-Heterococcus_DN1.PRE.3
MKRDPCNWSCEFPARNKSTPAQELQHAPGKPQTRDDGGAMSRRKIPTPAPDLQPRTCPHVQAKLAHVQFCGQFFMLSQRIAGESVTTQINSMYARFEFLYRAST